MKTKMLLFFPVPILFFQSGLNAVNAASLVNGQTLYFTAATTGGGAVAPTWGTGSYFGRTSPYSAVYVPISSYNGIVLGSSQPAIGSHSGAVNWTDELPTIDYPWEYLGSTGMHTSNAPVSVLGPDTIDFSGWGVHWNGGVVALGSGVSGGGAATYVYNGVSNAYTLDYSVSWFDDTFTLNTYTLHLEGAASPVPIPAAVWLFGSGLGLLGLARRKSAHT